MLTHFFIVVNKNYSPLMLYTHSFRLEIMTPVMEHHHSYVPTPRELKEGEREDSVSMIPRTTSHVPTAP